MTKNRNQINIARLIYDTYPHNDLLAIDPEQDCQDLKTLLAKVTTETIGDSLFRFIVVEIVEGGESNFDGAIRVMQRARDDIESVLQALQQKNTAPAVCDPEVELLEACKTLTSYTMDLLYRLDDQVDFSDIAEIQQAKKAIANCSRL